MDNNYERLLATCFFFKKLKDVVNAFNIFLLDMPT